MKLLWIILVVIPLNLLASPLAPSNLVLTPSVKSVDIAWVDNAIDETGYKIYRDDKLIYTTAPNVTKYHDSGLQANHTYSYTIYATDDLDDNAHLLQNLDIKVENSDEVIVKNANKYLMSAPKDVFVSLGKKLTLINKKFIPKTGGLDIEVTLKNDTDTKQPLEFYIEIPGIYFTDGDNINLLNTQTYMVPRSRIVPKNDGNVSNRNYEININPTGETKENHNSYPTGYSPVIIACDKNFAVGVSMLTSYNVDKLALNLLVNHNSHGSWSFIFKSARATEQGEGQSGLKGYRAKVLKSKQEEKITLAIRFADVSKDKDNWIYTLAPYKTFFNNRFSDKHIVEKDTSPILGMNFSYEGAKQNKPKESVLAELDDAAKERYRKGYINDGKYFSEHNYAKELKDKLSDGNHNYKRVIFWGVSGQYHGYDCMTSDDCGYKANGTYNLPSQFMTIKDETILNTLYSVQIGLTNISVDYGFWWGRSGQIPLNEKDGYILGYNDWNPQYIVPSNINKSEYHKNFALQELNEALDRGAKEIGLDAFSNMEITAQFDWIKMIKNHVKKQNKEVRFLQEGIICDYLHTEFSIFLQPNIEWCNRDERADFKSRPILVDYLNPNAEVIVWLKNIEYKNRDFIEILRGYGFTPLLEIKDGYPKNIPNY